MKKLISDPDEYCGLQEIRRELTKLSHRAAAFKVSKDPVTVEVATKIESELDTLRIIIFNVDLADIDCIDEKSVEVARLNLTYYTEGIWRAKNGQMYVWRSVRFEKVSNEEIQAYSAGI
jgi:hypothetical protein